jgi:hypothetical protein
MIDAVARPTATIAWVVGLVKYSHIYEVILYYRFPEVIRW